MSLPLLKPALYALDPDGRPSLLGGRCACGHVFFPMQTFGCERCGGVSLVPEQLTARGQLRAAATVHAHADDQRPVPFTIGVIALESGPVVRTLIVDAPRDEEAIGTHVEAVLVEVGNGHGERALDLRFRPVRA